VIRHIAFWNCQGQLADLEAAAKWLDEAIDLAKAEAPPDRHHV
jgi:hypothetical protein